MLEASWSLVFQSTDGSKASARILRKGCTGDGFIRAITRKDPDIGENYLIRWKSGGMPEDIRQILLKQTPRISHCPGTTRGSAEEADI